MLHARSYLSRAALGAPSCTKLTTIELSMACRSHVDPFRASVADSLHADMCERTYSEPVIGKSHSPCQVLQSKLCQCLLMQRLRISCKADHPCKQTPLDQEGHDFGFQGAISLGFSHLEDWLGLAILRLCWQPSASWHENWAALGSRFCIWC